MWSAAVIGVLQSHSSTVGCVGDSTGITWGAPTGIQALVSAELAGKTFQKSAGSGGRPAAAFAASSLTVTPFAGRTPRLCSCTYTRLMLPRRGLRCCSLRSKAT